MSSSLSVSTATNEGSGNKESTVGDSSSSKDLDFKLIIIQICLMNIKMQNTILYSIKLIFLRNRYKYRGNILFKLDLVKRKGHFPRMLDASKKKHGAIRKVHQRKTDFR